jgi:hypothetical protein
MTRSLDRNIIVICKIDTSMDFGWVIWYTKKLTLKPLIWRTWDMFTVSPLPVPGPASGTAIGIGAAARFSIGTCVESTVAA